MPSHVGRAFVLWPSGLNEERASQGTTLPVEASKGVVRVYLCVQVCVQQYNRGSVTRSGCRSHCVTTIVRLLLPFFSRGFPTLRYLDVIHLRSFYDPPPPPH